MKKLGIVLGVVAVLAVVAGVLLLTNLGAVVKAGVEKFGSEATLAPVTLEEADVRVTDGRATLRGLSVGNPQGYKTPRSFFLGEVTVRLDPATVGSDVIVLNEVVIASPQVTYEVGSDMKSNVARIQDNIEAYGKTADGEAAARRPKGGKGGKGGGRGEGKPAAEGADDSGGTRFVIDDLRMTGGKVTLGATLADGGVATVAIPDIHLKNLGRDEGGLTEAQLAVAILDSLAGASVRAATVGRLEEMGKGLLDKAKGVLDGILGK